MNEKTKARIDTLLKNHELYDLHTFLKICREIYGFTRVDLALLIGKCDQSIYAIESGNREITHLDLIDFSHIYHLPFDFLFNKKTNKKHV